MAPRLQIGVSVDGSDPPSALRALSEAAEAGGATNLWLACHLFNREPIASAAAVLAATRSLGTVLMAMSPYTVHPLYAAMAAATLDELFPGRVQLCFGVGAPAALEMAGIAAERPLDTLRETLELARLLLSGEPVTFAGRRYCVSGRLAMGSHRVPLWLAASGPRMLELAGEKADGVVISAGTASAFIGWCLDIVRRGEERGGRAIKKAALVVCSVDADAHRAHERVRRRLAYVLRGAHHTRNLEMAGTRLDQAGLADAFAHENWERVDELTTDDVIRRHCASGTPGEASAMLKAYGEAGLDEIVLYGMHEPVQLEAVLAVALSQGALAGR
jgi:5,10-methylenetetrahydromethanopterin reductase